MILIHFDGACWPKNPGGIATWAYTIQRRNAVGLYDRIEKNYGAIGQGEGMTNNLAEYTGLLEALKAVERLKLGDEEMMIYSDSKLVVLMVQKIWGGRTPHKEKPVLRKMLYHVWAYLDGKKYNIRWIPREANFFCDQLSKRAIRVFIRWGSQPFNLVEKFSPGAPQEATEGVLHP